MIRLSQMGDVVALDELIRKLESLEKKLSFPAASSEAVQAVDEKKVLPQKISEDDWAAFLKFVASKNKPMAKVLESCPFLEASAETVMIGKSPKPFDHTFFDESERSEKLKTYGLQFFKREVKMSFSPQKKGEEGQPPNQAPQAPPHPQEVQDVLNMFQGEIRGEVLEDQRRKES